LSRDWRLSYTSLVALASPDMKEADRLSSVAQYGLRHAMAQSLAANQQGNRWRDLPRIVSHGFNLRALCSYALA